MSRSEKLKDKIHETKNSIKELNNKLEELENEMKEIDKTGYEKVEKGKLYYFNDDFGTPAALPFDEDRWKNANYYNDENFAKMQARADTLWRKIRRWQALNDKPVDIHSCDSIKHYIYYRIMERNLMVDWCQYTVSAEVYFSSKERAEECIKEFKDELNWYFTKYKPRMDMEDDNE